MIYYQYVDVVLTLGATITISIRKDQIFVHTIAFTVNIYTDYEFWKSRVLMRMFSFLMKDISASSLILSLRAYSVLNKKLI